ncbi:MAG: ArsA-related P-loop ATPase, partial [Candidatus Binatia bacterium]
MCPDDAIRKVAIYGKGGIGKSTISANVSAALSQLGMAVMQIGCDPKHDSISTLCGNLMPTVMGTVRESRGDSEELIMSLVHRGFNGVLGVESGGPKPGTGCAGKGVLVALRLLDKYSVFEKFGVQFALFDVLGDLVCGGFAQPMR